MLRVPATIDFKITTAMKKIILLAAAMLMAAGVYGQKSGFINTEQIFRAIPEYGLALGTLDELARQEQVRVDADFARVAEMYERYQHQRQSLSENARKQVEDNIIRLEKEAQEKQAAFFGSEGTLMQKRIELLKPIQDRVFGVVDLVAKLQQCDVVIDISNNPSIVYYNPENDLTAEVLKSLGINK